MAMEVSDVDRREEPMKGQSKQVSKRADDNGQVTNPRIIIDASYIRGMKKDGGPLRTICEQGGRIVITDTLVRELIKADSNQWPTAISRFVECQNAIEVWAHVSEMYRVELRENHAYGDPLHPERTERLRRMLANNRQHSVLPPEQEKSSISELFQKFAKLNNEFEEIATNLQGKEPHDEEVVQTCYALINDPDNIRSMIQVIRSVMEYDMDVSLDPNAVDKTWAIWHFSKSLLTVFCDCLRQGEQVFKEISKKREKRLNNLIYDLDYLILLAFADAIASRKTKRELFYYRRWIFGDASKPSINYYENDRISLFVQKLRQMSKVITICVVEQPDGYMFALDPWSRISPKIQNSEVLPASVFISHGTEGHFELFHGSIWEHVIEILTGYSVEDLRGSSGVVFVDPQTMKILFEPSAEHA